MRLGLGLCFCFCFCFRPASQPINPQDTKENINKTTNLRVRLVVRPVQDHLPGRLEAREVVHMPVGVLVPHHTLLEPYHLRWVHIKMSDGANI